jgi:hypothetical protein
MKLLRALFIALVLSLSLAAAGCGDDDSVSSEEAAQQAEDAAEEATEDAETQAELDALRKKLNEDDDSGDSSDSGATTTPAPAPSSGGSGDDCGGGVRAGPNTSCPFALNVADEYRSSGGATRISVYSPTTGQTYRMVCSEGSPNVCTGGNNASVYIP